MLSSFVQGEYLPVVEIKNMIPYCFTGDAVIRGKKKQLTLVESDVFADGFVEVHIKKNQRDGVYTDNGLLRFSSKEDRYLFVATFTADRDINDCFVALGFDTFGKKSYHVRSLGKLEAGKKRNLHVFIRVGFEMPDNLHFFSGMEEVRTSLVPGYYSYENGNLLLAAK